MTDYTRVVFPVTTASPVGAQFIGTTSVVAWSEAALTYADIITDVSLTAFALASRIVDQIISGVIPAPKVTFAIDVVVALVLAAPVYSVHYDGAAFTVVTPPPGGYVEVHNWMGWPNHPII